MVKFGKNGTDVTTAAVRLARAHTNKTHVLVGGYHGWADWSMVCSNRRYGIPLELEETASHIKYGDTKDALFKFPKHIAAIIIEPGEDLNYLEFLRDWCNKHGTILIFDEIITGFRYDLGGAQALYGVTPDLACFGKAMANGMPISALVGKKEIMSLMNTPDVFYSGTFFGETLSLAAAIATINKMEREDVIGYVTTTGIHLEREILKLINKYGLQEHIKLTGWYTNQHIEFLGEYKDQMRAMFLSGMAQNGVLIINSNVLSYTHHAPEIKRIVTAYDATLGLIGLGVKSGHIKSVAPVEAAPVRAV
jgi:glutamate-1-semialdehyde aminotransferase